MSIVCRLSSRFWLSVMTPVYNPVGWKSRKELSGLTGEPEWKISGVIMRYGRILLFDAIYWREI